jgi:multisubunit Na+/H+ antiporter MnhE subunit
MAPLNSATVAFNHVISFFITATVINIPITFTSSMGITILAMSITVNILPLTLGYNISPSSPGYSADKLPCNWDAVSGQIIIEIGNGKAKTDP